MLSPQRVKTSLDGLQFPVSREEVVDRLVAQPDLKPEDRRAVQRLPDITYRKPADVVHNLDYVRTKAPYTRSGSAGSFMDESTR